MTEDKGRMNDYTSRTTDSYTYGKTEVAERPTDFERSDENKSSDEIKADIEQKRNEMTQKINKIQERLDPTRLKEQAQETVRGAVTDSTEAVVQYFRDNAGGFTSSLVDTIKHNPVPSALIGIGLGWLLVENFNGSSRQSSSSSYSDRYNDRRNANYSQYNARTQYGANVDDIYNAEYTSTGSTPGRNQYRTSTSNYQSGNQSAQYAGEMPHASGYTESGESALDQASGRVGQALQSVQDTASSVVDQARDKASQLTDQVQDTAQQATSYVQDQVGQVRDQASQLTDQAQQKVQQAGRQVQQTLESNPMPFGAAALVAGALLAMALPETRAENQMMGETRDQLMDSAQSVAQDVKQRVQSVVEEKLPEVKQSAQKVVEDLKQTGKDAAQDLKQTAKEFTQDLKQTGQDAGQDVKQTLKDAGDKATQTTQNSWQNTQPSSGPSASSAPEEEGSAKNTSLYGQTNR
jgi:gas vesicle protein